MLLKNRSRECLEWSVQMQHRFHRVQWAVEWFCSTRAPIQASRGWWEAVPPSLPSLRALHAGSVHQCLQSGWQTGGLRSALPPPSSSRTWSASRWPPSWGSLSWSRSWSAFPRCDQRSAPLKGGSSGQPGRPRARSPWRAELPGCLWELPDRLSGRGVKKICSKLF